MKNLTLWLLSLCLLAACSEDDPADLTSGGEAAPDAYDESQVPADQPVNNLLRNGDFESDDVWATCGGARLASTDAGQAMALTTESECEESRTLISMTNAVIGKEVSFSSLPALFTVSFEVWIEGDEPEAQLDVFLGRSADALFSPRLGGEFIGTVSEEVGNSPGWSRINLLVTPKLLDKAQGDAASFFLIFSLQNLPANSATVYLDNIIVTEGLIELAPISPMPEALRDYPGESRLVFFDLSSGEIQLATMLPNGTERVIYPQIDVSTVDGLPQWFGNNVVLSQKVFNPDAPADINVVPGGGSDVTRYDLASSRGEVAFQTVGQPGVYFFSGSFDNRPALDIEVRRTAWDSERNRGIINVCARNRSPEGVQSDDICYLYLVDATTFEELNTEVNGFPPPPPPPPPPQVVFLRPVGLLLR